jgi:uncharacterized membrane protein (DUF373 family)
MTRAIRFFFDVAIFVCIVALAVATIVSLIPNIILQDALHIPPYILQLLTPQIVIGVGLRILIVVKVYTILHSYLGEHKMRLTELFEIAITALVISMTFDNHGYTTNSLILLVILSTLYI